MIVCTRLRALFYDSCLFPLEFADDANDFGKLLILISLACNYYINLYSTFIKIFLIFIISAII